MPFYNYYKSPFFVRSHRTNFEFGIEYSIIIKCGHFAKHLVAPENSTKIITPIVNELAWEQLCIIT